MNSRVAVTGGVVTALLVLTASCSPTPSDEKADGAGATTSTTTSSSPTTGPPVDPATWEPIGRPTVLDSTPPPLPPKPDLDDVVEAGRAGPTAADAEAFAVRLSQLIIDTREPLDATLAMDRLAAPELASAERAYLEEDITGQHQLKSERRYDTSKPVFARSEVIGALAAPERVNVEIAGFVSAEAVDVRYWYRTRYDLTWHDDQWRLVAFRDGVMGANDVTDPSDVITGRGWRKINPA